MSWQTECTEILRVLINDLSDTPSYSDQRLERILIVAALQVTQEISFDASYTVNVSESILSPDPSCDLNRDNAMLNLMSLKAAVIILDSEVKYYAINSIRVNDGPSSIDTTARSNFVKSAAELMKEEYAQMKIMQATSQAGVAIMTPFTVPNIYPITRFQ